MEKAGLFPRTKWKDKKNRKIYMVLACGFDCTNSRDGIPVVVYSPEDDPHMIFVREELEFLEKFEEVE